MMRLLMKKSDLSMFECWIIWDTQLGIYLCGCITSVLEKLVDILIQILKAYASTNKIISYKPNVYRFSIKKLITKCLILPNFLTVFSIFRPLTPH